MSYPTFKEYEILYAKYRDRRSINELVDLAGDLSGRTVADLCCGNGEIGLECHKRGASTIALVDSGIDMLPWPNDLPKEVRVVKCPVEKFGIQGIDVAICRQGVNYWLTEQTALLMARLINKGGVFIFNTFNEKPPKDITVKEYDYKKNKYVEVNYMRGDMVYHTQICNSPDLEAGTHSTQFRWISPKEFEEWLSPYFHIERQTPLIAEYFNEPVEGKTDIYKCIRNTIEFEEEK
jgi:ubiquinone/menaquinone biosynthesis C-methylase UbiE